MNAYEPQSSSTVVSAFSPDPEPSQTSKPPLNPLPINLLRQKPEPHGRHGIPIMFHDVRLLHRGTHERPLLRICG